MLIKAKSGILKSQHTLIINTKKNIFHASIPFSVQLAGSSLLTEKGLHLFFLFELLSCAVPGRKNGNKLAQLKALRDLYN